MRKVLLILSTIIGLILYIDAFVLLTFTQSFGNILALCLGLVFVLIGIYYNRFSAWLQKLIKVVMAICIPVCIAMICFIAINSNKNSTTFTEDYVIVLGAGIKGEKILLALQNRLDRCRVYETKP
ncbi:MAG: hypothetical protein LBG19_04525 [Prevotellaceae bacterium]|jgi:amino acid transporter|nr:hypothetical protein [Prevotellaceae bacterium]